MNPDDFRQLGHRFVDWIADYWSRLDEFPVLSQVKPGDILAQLPKSPPATGLSSSGAQSPVPGASSWDPIFRDLESIILPGLTHWQSPGFYAYFPCNASPPAVLGELLSAGLNVQGMLWSTSPACTELEIRVLDWLADMLDLPADFRSTGPGGGVIQGTASEAALVALVAARDRARRAMASPIVECPLPSAGPFTLYASTQAHSSIIKAAMIAGLANSPDDREHLRLIETGRDLSMRPEALAAAIRADIDAGKVPCFIAATVGTTSTTAVDPVDRIAEAIASATSSLRHSVSSSLLPWLHVDAAHSGAACICPEHRWMLRGLERADSFCFNPHKWMLTNFDCDAFWTRDRAALTRALSITPEYLRNRASDAGAVTDYRDWQVPLGRRFRALKLWFVIRHYGVEGLRAAIRRHIALAERFERLVAGDERFELAARRTVNLVCFRVRAGEARADEINRGLLEAVNATGRVFLSHTVVPDAAGRPSYTLRMAIGSPATREEHIDRAWDLLREHAARLLGSGA